MQERQGDRVQVLGHQVGAMTDEEFERYMKTTLSPSGQLAFAKAIRARRRRLGQYGFSTRKMAVPK